MSLGERCDEIVQLIERTLAEVDADRGPAPATTVTPVGPPSPATANRPGPATANSPGPARANRPGPATANPGPGRRRAPGSVPRG